MRAQRASLNRLSASTHVRRWGLRRNNNYKWCRPKAFESSAGNLIRTLEQQSISSCDKRCSSNDELHISRIINRVGNQQRVSPRYLPGRSQTTARLHLNCVPFVISELFKELGTIGNSDRCWRSV